MERRRFGRTGLEVPALIFGGGWVGGVLMHKAEDEAFAALDLALRGGMDWIDTAAAYGQGASETVIGRWLAAREGARPSLSTKFRLGPGERDPLRAARASLEASFGRLGVDRVETVFLHDPVGGPKGLSAREALGAADAMARLAEEGLFRASGMTALGDPAALAEVVDEGRFDAAQVYVNLLNPTAIRGRSPWNATDFDGLLARCAARDMGVMGIRVFAAGHIPNATRTGREIPLTANSDDAAEAKRAEALRAALTPEDGDAATAAIRFALSIPEVSGVVVGLAELSHLEAALAAERRGPLPAARLEALEAVWGHPAFTA
ncbi:MAG: aldo/keto reductase [Paracoccaceae bacterium]